MLIFIILFGVCLGFFSGILYVIPLNVISNYYEEKKGLVLGIGMGFFGFSSVIGQILIICIVNPENIPLDKHGLYPKAIVNRLPLALQAISVFVFIIGTLGSFLLKNKKIEL